jgi:hypothetical protein
MLGGPWYAVGKLGALEIAVGKCGGLEIVPNSSDDLACNLSEISKLESTQKIITRSILNFFNLHEIFILSDREVS